MGNRQAARDNSKKAENWSRVAMVSFFISIITAANAAVALKIIAANR